MFQCLGVGSTTTQLDSLGVEKQSPQYTTGFYPKGGGGAPHHAHYHAYAPAILRDFSDVVTTFKSANFRGKFRLLNFVFCDELTH